MKRNSSAFTLLELLVAMSIALLIAGMMLAVVTSTLDLWGRQQAEQSASIAARQILDLLERDFQAAVSDDEPVCWLAADVINSSGGLTNHGWLLNGAARKPEGDASLLVVPPPEASGLSRIEDARFGLSGVWLRFVTTHVEAGASLPVVVAYQIARRPVTGDTVSSNPAPVRYGLYRSVVSDAESFANGYDVLASAYGSTTNTPSSALGTAYRQPRNVTNPSHANLLAANVVDFGCWFYQRAADGSLVRIFPANDADLVHHATGGATTAAARFPDFVDVMVRIMGESGATALEALESGRLVRPANFASDADWWWDIVQRHSQVFVRRIEVRRSLP